MIKQILSTITIASLLFINNVYGQDEPDNRPVRSPFEASYLMENQTIVSPYQGSLQFQMQHRFGLVENGIEDIFGIYAEANTRLGLTYGITDKLMVGIGTEKDNKMQDLHWKYAILQQTRSGSVPVSISYFGNVVLDARDKTFFYPQNDYKFIHRVSYFTQFIVSRKFSDMISWQVAPSLVYFNAVEPGVNNLHYGVYTGGRVKVLPSLSVITEYNYRISENENIDANQSLGIGAEISTSTHAFQIFLTNYNSIIPQKNMVYGSNDLSKGKFLIGFNINAVL